MYTYNQADKARKLCSVDQTGTPRSVPLTIEGNIWTYNSEMEKDGKRILIKTINDFSKPGIVLWNTKFSSDGGAHWTLMNEGVDSKVRRKALLRPTMIGSRGEIWRLPEKCR